MIPLWNTKLSAGTGNAEDDFQPYMTPYRKDKIRQLLLENNKIGESKTLGTFQKRKKEIIDGFSTIELYTITSQSSYLFPYSSQKQLGK